MRDISDDERRARLVRRHGLGRGFADLAQASESMLAWHATEAATVHLAAWARVPDLALADVDQALYDDRSLVKQLAMRRTLFAFPRDLVPAAWGSAAARVAREQRALMAKDVEKAGIATDGAAWVEAACSAVLERLAEPMTTSALRQELPELAGRVRRGTPDKKWSGEFPIAPRVLTLLGAEGRVVRAQNAGHWRLNKPTWVRTEHWLPDVPAPLDEAAGYAVLVERWLRTFGPGTEADIAWWLGATKAAVRRALSDVAAEEVGLENGTGFVLPDDEEEPPVDDTAALLPTLDPTVMGWKERAFYLVEEDRPFLFDRNGNAGNTAWWGGRIVGAWAQDSDAVVHVLPRATLPRKATKALQDEAARLTAFLDGVRIQNPYASAQMRSASLQQ